MYFSSNLLYVSVDSTYILYNHFISITYMSIGGGSSTSSSTSTSLSPESAHSRIDHAAVESDGFLSSACECGYE